MYGAGAIRSRAAGREMEDVIQDSAGQGGQKGSKRAESRQDNKIPGGDWSQAAAGGR